MRSESIQIVLFYIIEPMIRIFDLRGLTSTRVVKSKSQNDRLLQLCCWSLPGKPLESFRDEVEKKQMKNRPVEGLNNQYRLVLQALGGRPIGTHVFESKTDR